MLRGGNRNKLDICANIMQVVEMYGRVRITKLSYGVGVPIDRLKPMVSELCALGLLRMEVAEEETSFGATSRGLEFLDAYRKMKSYLEMMDPENAS
ncbi:MAG TPA: winged helix-turn-helix domain-containing protein [Nitrososphaerales archaeon]|nr:winged helix-turn-helix domain-containing protein [Nitrososphaerales archaeon]